VSDTTDIISAVGSAISAIAACVAAAGVWYARHQLKTSREIAQLQFEDALGKEYRELAGELSKKALMGDLLSDTEYEEAFDELYRYVDLTNEQISLRVRGRITSEVWHNWLEGIEANLKLPAFSRAWTEIKTRSSGFEELRRLEREMFKIDPKYWH
jgi:aminopeptidase N